MEVKCHTKNTTHTIDEGNASLEACQEVHKKHTRTEEGKHGGLDMIRGHLHPTSRKARHGIYGDSQQNNGKGPHVDEGEKAAASESNSVCANRLQHTVALGAANERGRENTCAVLLYRIASPPARFLCTLSTLPVLPA